MNYPVANCAGSESRRDGEGFHATFDLIHSMVWRDLRCAERTLERGANIDYQASVEDFRHEMMMNSDDQTRQMTSKIWEGIADHFINPLMIAVEVGFPDGVRWLAERGANPNVHSGEPEFVTPLHVAIGSSIGSRAQRDELVESLLSFTNLNIGLPSEAYANCLPGYAILLAASPLTKAITDHDDDVAKRLLERGADPNMADPNGDTALGTAAQENRPAIAQALLLHGARPDAPDHGRDGKAPRDIAYENGHLDVVDVIDEFMDMGALAAIAPTKVKKSVRRHDMFDGGL